MRMRLQNDHILHLFETEKHFNFGQLSCHMTGISQAGSCYSERHCVSFHENFHHEMKVYEDIYLHFDMQESL